MQITKPLTLKQPATEPIIRPKIPQESDWKVEQGWDDDSWGSKKTAVPIQGTPDKEAMRKKQELRKAERAKRLAEAKLAKK